MTVFLAPVLTLCFAFPGYIANDLIHLGILPPVEHADRTYPHLVTHLLGPGFRGFMVAAVVGAIMSSIAAIVNATASVFTSDLYQRWISPNAEGKTLIRVGRIAGLATLVIAYPLVMVAANYRYIFTYSQNAWCILAIPIMLVFTFGAMWKRITTAAATLTFVAVIPFVAVPFIFGNAEDNYLSLPLYTEKVHLFNFAFVLWVVAAVFMVVVSLLTPAPDVAKVAPFVWKPAFTRALSERGETYPWYASVGFWSVVAGVLIGAIYILLW
jgi:SSS family solute:Na+ symporter